MSEWENDLKKLAEIAISEPQAAFSGYIHGQQHKFNYFFRTIPGMESFLDPFDDILNEQLIPAILALRSVS